jgi:hypothetical protein
LCKWARRYNNYWKNFTMITFQPLNKVVWKKPLLLMQEFYAIDNYPIDVLLLMDCFKNLLEMKILVKLVHFLQKARVVGSNSNLRF